MYRLILYLLVLYFCVNKIKCENPEVEVPQGKLSGGIRKNMYGEKYYSFKNIPYGKPPIGELRFKAPQKADSWEGIRNATEDLPLCVQPGNIIGQEDCLYLNVYTPGLPIENVTNLAVMVWIHGGSFYAGSATEKIYGAQFLLTRKVILVTINYRLGIFGFLSLDDATLGVTGNAGLKDQVLALEWVRDNIKYFGGDPNNVLIFGEDAGGMSVQLLVLSPLAKGLFRRAISQSGDALTELLRPVTRNNAKTIAKALGIQTENRKDMLVSLQSLSANDLASAELGFHKGFYQFFTGPVVEIRADGTFLDSKFIDIIRSGNYNQVPFIIGINEADGLLFQFLSQESYGEPLFIENFTDFIPSDWNLNQTLQQNLSQIIKDFYYDGTAPSKFDITKAVDLTTDYAFAFPAYRTVREYLATAKYPIYFYYFTAMTDMNFFRRLDDSVASFPSAAHADELGYLFHMSMTPSTKRKSYERRGIINMVNLWANFAIHGNPTPQHSSDFRWAPVTDNRFNYLHIGTKSTYLVRDSVITEDRMEFWWSLYEKYSTK